MSTAGSPSVRRPAFGGGGTATGKPSIFNRLSASPSVSRPPLGNATRNAAAAASASLARGGGAGKGTVSAPAQQTPSASPAPLRQAVNNTPTAGATASSSAQHSPLAHTNNNVDFNASANPANGSGSNSFGSRPTDPYDSTTISLQTSKAPSLMPMVAQSIRGSGVAPPHSITDSSIAFDTEQHIKNFNDELVRDNELMLQEIEELRDENDIMFDELHRLRTENALLKEQTMELTESVNGQNEAFVRLSSEVAREMTITESLRKTFDTLHANRFDNLFTKYARAKHASLGRPPTTRENLELARVALDESNRQINNIFEIVHSMSQVPNFMTNPKDVLIVDATMQVISLCKVINSMIVAEKMSSANRNSTAAGGGGGSSNTTYEAQLEQEHLARYGTRPSNTMASAIASLTPRPGSSPAAQKRPQTARGAGSGGGIAGFFKRIGNKDGANNKTTNNDGTNTGYRHSYHSSAAAAAAVEEVETLVTVLTARAGEEGPHHRNPNALQLPNENIHMPVSAKEVDKRATLLQRIASVFSSSHNSHQNGPNSGNVSRTSSFGKQQQPQLPPKRVNTPPPLSSTTATSNNNNPTNVRKSTAAASNSYISSVPTPSGAVVMTASGSGVRPQHQQHHHHDPFVRTERETVKKSSDCGDNSSNVRSLNNSPPPPPTQTIVVATAAPQLGKRSSAAAPSSTVAPSPSTPNDASSPTMRPVTMGPIEVCINGTPPQNKNV